MSVNKGLDPIDTKNYLNARKDWDRIKENLKEYGSVLSEFDDCISDSLVDTNINIIKKTCEWLGIKTKIVTDWDTSLTSTERLVDICDKLEATSYLSGQSGKDYMDFSLFSNKNIRVEFQPTNTIIQRPILEVLKNG